MKQRNTNKRHTDLPTLTYMHITQYNLHRRIVYTQRCLLLPMPRRAQGTRHNERSSGACAADDSCAAWPCHDSTGAGSENKRENGYSPFQQRGHSYLAGMQATPERNKGSSILSHSHSHSHTTLAMAFARLVVQRTRRAHSTKATPTRAQQYLLLQRSP